MKLRVLSSGSQGNCYLLESETECLILDAGIPLKEIKKALDFNISKIVGVFITHSHKDHSLSMEDFKIMGIPVFAPYLGGSSNVKLGSFILHSFPLPHDGVENRGVLIEEPTIGKMLYMTDYEYCHLTFKSYAINTMLIEANYEADFVDKDIPNWEHVLKGHASLDVCKEIIHSNMTKGLQNVILCHLSNQNASPTYFLDEVKNIVPSAVTVNVARQGLELDITNKNKCPF